MERSVIIEKLSSVFRNVFSDEQLEIKDELTAKDVENWDSLSHMILISEVENAFSIKFKLKDLNKMKNVGDMINNIASKI